MRQWLSPPGNVLSEADQADGGTGSVTGYSCSALLQPANYCYWGISRPPLSRGHPGSGLSSRRANDTNFPIALLMLLILREEKKNNSNILNQN